MPLASPTINADSPPSHTPYHTPALHGAPKSTPSRSFYGPRHSTPHPNPIRQLDNHIPISGVPRCTLPISATLQK
jgi:hypothetical protein